MRKSHSTDNSLRIAAIFVSCILLLIVGGFLLKVFLVLRASHFDSTHQYIVEVDESSSKGVLISFAPGSRSVTLLTVNGKVDTSFGQYLDVPVDGSIHMAIPGNPTQLTQNMLFAGKGEKNLTVIDKLRLLLFVNTLKSTDFHEESIQLPIDAKTSEKLLPALFQDSALYSDNESVSVVNATGQDGTGTKVAKMLSTIGINVVSVTTSPKEDDTTRMVSLNPYTYTATRVGRLFGVYAVASTEHTIADIIITIGKNSLSQLQ